MGELLLADDDIELCEMLSRYFLQEGFETDIANDGETALHKAMSGQYELIVLDVMMPKLNGLDVLREIRKHILTPVLILTARGEDIDSILGLELGADDYLAKPCNPRVIVARIRAILRRASLFGMTTQSQNPLRVDDVELYTTTRTVNCQSKPVELTSTEYAVLECLLQRAGDVVSKDTLSQQALGRRLSPYDRSLDMHISNIRKKLGPATDGTERIKTVRKHGYFYIKSNLELHA